MSGINAQQPMNDLPGGKTYYTTIRARQVKRMNEIYSSHVNNADELINGREYVPYYFKCREKPLLYEDVKRTGSVILNGRKYDNLNLEYDTYLDQLIYSDYSKLIDDKIFKISLNKDLISEFRLYFEHDSLAFMNLRSDRNHKSDLPDGFYEIIYNGRSSYIIKHQSVYIENEGAYEYRYTPVCYISTGGDFIRIKSASGFRKAFGDRSDAIRKYMRVNGISYRSALRNEIAAVMKYFDSIVQEGDRK
jgi:hypothetical protein